LLVSGYRIIVGKSHTRGRVDVTASEMVRG
jgi:hypothetical protein